MITQVARGLAPLMLALRMHTSGSVPNSVSWRITYDTPPHAGEVDREARRLIGRRACRHTGGTMVAKPLARPQRKFCDCTVLARNCGLQL
jgi:hypothetical protein